MTREPRTPHHISEDELGALTHYYASKLAAIFAEPFRHSASYNAETLKRYVNNFIRLQLDFEEINRQWNESHELNDETPF